MIFSLFKTVLSTFFLMSILLPNIACAASEKKAWAYMAWWLPESWKNAPLEKLDRLLFFELKVNAKGYISEKNGWPEKWTALSEQLKKTNTPLDLTLTLLTTKDFEAVFASDAATQTLLEQTANLASDHAVAGIHLDFEVYTIVSDGVQKRFQKFVVDLAKKLRSIVPAKNLSIFLPVGGATQIYSKEAIAQVNHVVAQSYDAHWPGGPNAGPIAPLDGDSAVTWKTAMNQALALGVKPDKLLLSYPFFGYEWQLRDKNPRGANLTRSLAGKTTLATLTDANSTDFSASVDARIKSTKAVNDESSGSSYYQFQTNGQWTTGWFEGDWALRRKTQFIEKQKLAGMAFFVLGYDNHKLLKQFVKH
jgi:spore germination protein